MTKTYKAKIYATEEVIEHTVNLYEIKGNSKKEAEKKLEKNILENDDKYIKNNEVKYIEEIEPTEWTHGSNLKIIDVIDIEEEKTELKCDNCGHSGQFIKEEVIKSDVFSKEEVYNTDLGDAPRTALSGVFCPECGTKIID